MAIVAILMVLVIVGLAVFVKLMDQVEVTDVPGSTASRASRSPVGGEPRPGRPSIEGPMKVERWESTDDEFAPKPGMRGKGLVFRGGEFETAVAFDDCLFDTWDDLGVCVLEVAGETHHTTDLQKDVFAAGQPIRLKPDPNNRFDRNAIEVLSWTGSAQAGFVPKGDTAKVRELFRVGEVKVAALWSWYGRNGERRSLKLVAFRPGALEGLDDIPVHPPVR